MQEKIRYKDIMSLGFEESIQNDPVYKDTHGYEWAIVKLHITKNLYFDWEKDTRLVTLIRTKKQKDIVSSMPIRNMKMLQDSIEMLKTMFG